MATSPNFIYPQPTKDNHYSTFLRFLCFPWMTQVCELQKCCVDLKQITTAKVVVRSDSHPLTEVQKNCLMEEMEYGQDLKN